MASHRVGEAGLSGSGPSNHHHPHHHHHHHLPYAVFPGLNHSNSSFINQEGPSFDFGELEEAIVLQGIKINNDESKLPLYNTGGSSSSTRPAPAATLEMFPSWPMRFHQTTTPTGVSSKSGGGGGAESTDSGSALNYRVASKAEEEEEEEEGEDHFGPESPISTSSRRTNSGQQGFDHQQHQGMLEIPSQVDMDSEDSPRTGEGTSSQSQGGGPAGAPKSNLQKRRGAGSTSDRVLDPKTLRRLAQNREAARKSRLRKKAYVQQLETSRIRLTQLEQDLQRARSQGLFLGGGGGAGGSISSGAAIFDMEYARWLDDDQRHMAELRTGLHAHLSDGDLRVVVDGYIAHYDEVFSLKGAAAKSDVFHLITGMWATPAERCFLWMGGFRPSELIKMLAIQLDPLTEQQVVGIYSLQHSSTQAEEALTQGLDQLQTSLIETIASGSVNDGMHHMAIALGKLSNLEGFVRQADNLRQQTLHQLRRILTVRQAARCFLVIGEYYGRLRALSSLWASRPRETMISDDNSCQTSTDLQMVQQQAQQHHFSNF